MSAKNKKKLELKGIQHENYQPDHRVFPGELSPIAGYPRMMTCILDPRRCIKR